MEIPSRKIEIIEKIEYVLEDYKLLCIYAFDVITSNLKKNKIHLKIPDKFNNKQYPLFVTWSSGKEKSLRGCIGTFASDDLEKNLTTYSYYAAFKDTRFRPITEKELCHLHCGVSLLAEFEEAADAFDWEVGRHGITINFKSDNGRKHHATFLPEVASDREWDKKTTLNHLIQKAGYCGKLNDVVDSIKLTRYQSIKAGLYYDEYLSHKDNFGKNN